MLYWLLSNYNIWNIILMVLYVILLLEFFNILWNRYYNNYFLKVYMMKGKEFFFTLELIIFNGYL